MTTIKKRDRKEENREEGKDNFNIRLGEIENRQIIILNYLSEIVKRIDIIGNIVYNLNNIEYERIIEDREEDIIDENINVRAKIDGE